MDFEEMMGMAAAAKKNNDSWGTNWKTAVEMIAELNAAEQERAELLSSPCPFFPGDFITPKKGMGKKGRGKPFKVLSVFPVREQVYEDGSPYEVEDMNILVLVGDNWKCYPEFSGNYEMFDPDLVDM